MVFSIAFVPRVHEFCTLSIGRVDHMCLGSVVIVEKKPIPRISADCTICLDELRGGDKSIIIVTCCNNRFHSACYMNFMAIKPECPLCRATFANVPLPETHAIGDTFIHSDNVNVHERSVFAVCKRINLIFGLAICVCVLYLSLNWIEP